MARVERFEDLEVWKLARELVRDVYRVSASPAFSRDFALRDQVRRSAISVLSDIAEGFERNGDKEFAQFCSEAKGSCGELRAQLYAALDQGYLSDEEFQSLRGKCLLGSRLLASLMRYLRKSGMRGSKYAA